MISFIHTADIHFGMENYGKIDPKTGIHSRLLDFEKALNFCIDFAIEQSVDFFLFSGDAYKTAHPSPTQQKLLMRCLFRLYNAQIPIVIVVGNHDHPLSFGKAHALDVFGNLPVDGFHVISKPTSLTLNTKNGPINIVGIPWPTRNTISIAEKFFSRSATDITEHIAHGVGAIIRNFAQALDPSVPAVLAGHLTVSSGVFSGSEKRAIYGTDPVLMPSQLAIEPFDYVALGHLHRYQNLNPQGYPAIVYSGSIERVDFGERKEEKGFCYVTINKKNETSHEFIKTPTRKFIQIETHLTAHGDQTQELLNAINAHSIENAVVKIIYHIPAETTHQVNVKTIQQACEKAQYLVGAYPIIPQKTREQRAAVNINMDLGNLLNAYFDQKKEYSTQKNSLISKALSLREFLENE
jgi:DNA repair protein SbcD/Mre11